MRLLLVRHCAASGQEPTADLTPEGFSQSESLATFLSERSVDQIISSPYVRAINSVLKVADRLNIAIKTDVRLIERRLGCDGDPKWLDCLSASFDDLSLRFGDGESGLEAMQRGRSVVNELIGSSSKLPVVVTHGNLLVLILKSFAPSWGFQHWKSLTNPDVFELELLDVESAVRRIWG